MFGSFAEMHSSHYMDTNSMTELALLLDSLIDDDIYLSVRTPQHLRTIFKTADISKLKSDGHRIRMGLFNDGMLGSYIDVGTMVLKIIIFPMRNMIKKETAARK